MHKLKAFALFALVLAFVFVTACSSGSGTGEKSPNEAQPEANGGTKEGDTKEGDKKAESEEPKEPEDKIDLQGYTMKILVWGSGPQGGTETGDLQIAREKELEAKYNVNIEWVAVPWGESVPKITAAGLSGEPAADIALLHNYWAFPSLAEQGYIRTIDDLLNFDDPKWPKRMKEFGSFNGKLYGMTPSVGSAYGLFYNRSMLKREGLPDPQELLKQDQWTWDKYLEIAKKTTKDTDGDGTIDQWGVVAYSPMHARPLIYSNNGKIVDVVDGKLTFTMGESNAMEALRFLYDMHNTHKVVMPNKTASYADYEESQKVFNSGKAAFVPGAEWEGGGRKDMEDEYGFVYFPKGPKASEYTNISDGFAMWFVMANSKHPKEVARIFDEMQLWDRLDQQTRDWLDTNFRTSADVDMVFEMAERVEPLYINGIGSGEGSLGTKEGEAVKEITNLQVAPESAVEKIKKPMQELLDSVMNKK